MRDWTKNELLAVPAYSPAEASRILSVGYTTLMYWIAGRGHQRALIKLANATPPELSFLNLIECHALKALTVRYGLRMTNVRNGLETLKKRFNTEHPLLDDRFRTDGVHLFHQETSDSAPENLSRGGSSRSRRS